MYRLNTNKPTFFQHSTLFETGLSDFHLLTVIKFKMGFQLQKTKIVTYRKYETFDNEKLRSNVLKQSFDKNNFGTLTKNVKGWEILDTEIKLVV